MGVSDSRHPFLINYFKFTGMRKIVFSFCFLMVTSLLVAQNQKKQAYNDFSRWSLGLNGGISIFRGDMVSFSADKTYIGGQGGLQLGYQFTPRVVFFMCCLLWAGLTQAQEKKITAEFKDTPLSNVLKQLEKLSTYKILFTYDDVQSYKVTVSLKDATITEALQKVLDGKPFVFSDVANGKYISVVYQPKKKSDTTKEIKGKVVDSKGETVIGATVRGTKP